MKSTPSGPVPNDARALALHDAISAQARLLWERYGRPEGRDLAIWLEAQDQVLGVDRPADPPSHGPAQPTSDRPSPESNHAQRNENVRPPGPMARRPSEAEAAVREPHR